MHFSCLINSPLTTFPRVLLEKEILIHRVKTLWNLRISIKSADRKHYVLLQTLGSHGSCGVHRNKRGSSLGLPLTHSLNSLLSCSIGTRYLDSGNAIILGSCWTHFWLLTAISPFRMTTEPIASSHRGCGCARPRGVSCSQSHSRVGTSGH